MVQTRTNSKRKGARVEREGVDLLKRCGFRAWRGQQYKGSPESPDIICPSLPHIECTNRKDIGLGTKALEAKIEQAREDSETDEFIVLWKPVGYGWRLTWVDGLWGVPVTVAGEDRIRQVLIKMSEA